LQALPHARDEAFRIGGRIHALAVRDENVVAEIVAEPPERGAHCGLAEMHLARRRGHAAQRNQRIERNEQIQVESTESHTIHPSLMVRRTRAKDPRAPNVSLKQMTIDQNKRFC